MVMILTTEKNSLRFYQGDIDNYEMPTEMDKIKYSTSFYKTEKAYNLLNMLLYPEMDNEYARIWQEGKKIPIPLLRNMEELLAVYENIFSLMCKSSLVDQNKMFYVYRKDRMQSMEMLEAGYTFGFTSCSLADESDPYFIKKKAGILLLEVVIPGHIPHICVNEILGKNKFSAQEEVLLPPFVHFEKEQMAFTEKEQLYRDINNEVPKAKYLLKMSHMDLEEQKGTLEKIVKNAEMAEDILYHFEQDYKITQEEYSCYCQWKAEIYNYVRNRFSEIHKKIKEV